MSKFLLRLFLTLCLVFLGGYSHLYAHTNQGSVHHSSTKILKSSAQASFLSTQQSLALISKPATSQTIKRPFKLKATQENEEKEEEQVLIASKKVSDSSNYFSALFWAQTLIYFLRFGHDTLSACASVPFIPATRRHLLLQVFRI
jgi:hypothetical protein